MDYHRHMRATHAQTLASREGDQLLTTGEAARILGVSRQHVVDLCEAGDLPHTLAGKHRRVYRSDVEAVRTGRTRMNRQDTQSLILAHAIAGEIVRNPEVTITKAKHNLAAMKDSPSRGSTRVWLNEWESLLNGPIINLLQALTASTQRSRELRQNSPFAGVLSETARQQALLLARNGPINS